MSLCSDPYEITRMYYSIKTSGGLKRNCCIRTTSPLEGFHSPFATVLHGHNTSPVLAHAQQLVFIGRWNVKAGIKHKDDVDYGIFEHR